MLENCCPHFSQRVVPGPVSVGGVWESFLMQATGISTDSVEATLSEVSRLHTLRARAEARLFELAAVFADQHSGDSLPASGRVLPGMERAVRVGGPGTPTMAELAWAELGARLQMSPWSARQYVADALDTRHRLPLTWARVMTGEARVGNARRVAARTRHLSVEAAALVDQAMVDHLDGSLPWGRFTDRLDGQVVKADPAAAAARENAAARDQFAQRTRSSEDGTAGFYVRSTVGVIARLDATVAFVAEALKAFGDTDPDDLRRVKAVAVLANPVRAVELLAAFGALRHDTGDVDLELPDQHGFNKLNPRVDVPLDALDRMDAFARRVGFTPWRLPAWLTPPAASPPPAPPPPTPSADPPEPSPPGPEFRFDWARLLPPLTLYLHLDAQTLAAGTGGVVRWEGEGPVTHAFVRDHLRPLHAYVIKPVIDLAHQAPVDAYELPDRLREAVTLMTPTDVFPYASANSRHLDVDHTIAYDTTATTTATQPEKHWSTRIGNLGPLGRFHHRIKTHGRWTVRQPFPGIYLWRDPHGALYLQDHTGTHPVEGARTFDPDLHLYPAANVIQVDFPRHA
jgi:hypothetical protein